MRLMATNVWFGLLFFSNLDLFPNDIESYESVELEGRTTLAGGSRYFQPIRIDL